MLEIAVTSTSAVVGIVKEFALFDLPFLFASEQEADAVLDGAAGSQLLDKLPPKGLVGLPGQWRERLLGRSSRRAEAGVGEPVDG